MGLGSAVVVTRKFTVFMLALTLLSTAAFAEDSEKRFTPAGATDVAVVGEPVHVGDELTASILVHNQGSEIGSVRLVLNDSNGLSLSQGEYVAISPGSSREVSASLVPTSAGTTSMSWEIVSDDGGVSSQLQGSLELLVYEAQSLDLNFGEVDWTLAGGLHSQISVALSAGDSRDVNISVSLGFQGVDNEVQRFTVTLDPGLREISLDLGGPQADSLSVTIEPRGWTTSNSAANLTWQVDLAAPSISPSVELGPLDPEKPNPGQSVSLPYWLNNSGDAKTLPGELRVVRVSNGMLLAERTVSSVSASGSSSGTVEIGLWPDSQIIEVEVIWFMEGSAVSESLSVESSGQGGGGLTLPFDIMAAFYGALSGFAVVLVGIIAWRTVSERTPSTEGGEGKVLRDSRITRRLENAPAKREVLCPGCEQRLNIPSEHTGTVRCPACTTQFSTETDYEDPTVQPLTDALPKNPESSETPPDPEPAPWWPVARSTEEILSCPECDQRLRIPLERRPVHSRCPACRTEFIAELG